MSPPLYIASATAFLARFRNPLSHWYSAMSDFVGTLCLLLFLHPSASGMFASTWLSSSETCWSVSTLTLEFEFLTRTASWVRPSENVGLGNTKAGSRGCSFHKLWQKYQTNLERDGEVRENRLSTVTYRFSYCGCLWRM